MFGLKIWLCCFLATQSWTIYLAYLSLSLVICKIKVIIVAPPVHYCESMHLKCLEQCLLYHK